MVCMSIAIDVDIYIDRFIRHVLVLNPYSIQFEFHLFFFESRFFSFLAVTCDGEFMERSSFFRC